MARRKKQNYPLIEALEITTLAAEGMESVRFVDAATLVQQLAEFGIEL